MKVSLAPEAETDLVEGGLYYSREANKELAHAFISEFGRSVALLAEQPHSAHFGGRGSASSVASVRLPHRLYLNRTSVRVLAVAHQSRKPGFWRDRTWHPFVVSAGAQHLMSSFNFKPHKQFTTYPNGGAARPESSAVASGNTGAAAARRAIRKSPRTQSLQ